MENTYGLLKEALNVSAQRAQLNANNIANVNTPNYKAKRIEFESLLDNALDQQTHLTTTSARHMQAGGGITPQETSRSNTTVKENGNNVDLDVEMLNQAQNGLYYSALTSQLKGRYQMMSYVINH
ncbi:flagellar basal body rod protein FlgB [Ligilactobacillus salitolerans]|uniref:Flagellar basal body rod protein FlgB n=1 Tax=Ligilactobacillus salitolerans TaxID=1808352 RepID=A0A401ITU7_9LACO|nr:flagellar basal body rod protein FlgB [Ligilactobacillus salitolerans]GBG94936.1 flagellar basal body rod protein FlgB [Ligilactobacillus salitolerans]